MAKIEFYAKFLIVLITIIFIVSFIEYQTELRVDEDRISVAERSLEDFPLSIIQKPKQKIVCIPDVHGDYNNTLRSLRLANVIDTKGNWIGGSTILVQLGDIFDRGWEPKECIDFFIKLKTQIDAAGGELVQLIGNHDWLNLDDQDTGPIRDHEYDMYGGKEKRKIAISMEGPQGRYMRMNGKAFAVVHGNVFAHAGVEPVIAKMNPHYANDIFSNALQKTIKGDSWGDTAKIIGGQGPFWTRLFSINANEKQHSHGNTEEDTCKGVSETLKIMGAKRMIIGHNRFADAETQQNRVRHACNDTLIDLDIGLSDINGGFATAMIIDTETNDYEIKIKNCTWKGMYNRKECSEPWLLELKKGLQPNGIKGFS